MSEAILNSGIIGTQRAYGGYTEWNSTGNCIEIRLLHHTGANLSLVFKVGEDYSHMFSSVIFLHNNHYDLLSSDFTILWHLCRCECFFIDLCFAWPSNAISFRKILCKCQILYLTENTHVISRQKRETEREGAWRTIRSVVDMLKIALYLRYYFYAVNILVQWQWKYPTTKVFRAWIDHLFNV